MSLLIAVFIVTRLNAVGFVNLVILSCLSHLHSREKVHCEKRQHLTIEISIIKQHRQRKKVIKVTVSLAIFGWFERLASWRAQMCMVLKHHNGSKDCDSSIDNVVVLLYL